MMPSTAQVMALDRHPLTNPPELGRDAVSAIRLPRPGGGSRRRWGRSACVIVRRGTRQSVVESRVARMFGGMNLVTRLLPLLMGCALAAGATSSTATRPDEEALQ